jgi:Mrp family chromosome partitioning ATPase
VRALENESRIAGARVETLSASLDQLKGQAATSNDADVHLRALERDAKSQRDLLESYLAKYREATARDSINAVPADARIISRATASNVPVFPKRIPMVLVAAMLTLMLGIGITATRELLSPDNFRPIAALDRGYPDYGSADRIGGRSDVAPSRLALPERALPSEPKDDSQPALPVPTEVIEDLAQDLQQTGDAGRRVAVFGAARGVGTSLAAITLARALNREGRVVLIDLALEAPNLAVISTDPQAPGIVELIEEEAGAADVIMRDQVSAVHVIGAGRRGGDATTVLQSPRLVMTIEALAQAYEHIVIDAGAVADAPAECFAALAPTAVLVVADPEHHDAEGPRERLYAAGFAEVAVVVATG